jgi:hypothetical protein
VNGVLRLLRGEPLAQVAEDLGVATGELLSWRDAFLAGGQERLRQGAPQAGTVPAPSDGPTRRRRRRRPGARRRTLIAASAVLLVVVIVSCATVIARSERDITDGWTVVHDGFGKVGSEAVEDGRAVHFLKPMAARAPEETHAALLVSDRAHGDVDLRLRVRTVQQLRAGSAPNPWETAWIAWHYRDDEHFYYLALKPNGWELGKRDPAFPGGQRFLASDTVPVFFFNTWYDVRVVQIGADIDVSVGGTSLTRFTDHDQPYLDGRIGLYTEDAYAQFEGVAASAPRATPATVAGPPPVTR